MFWAHTIVSAQHVDDLHDALANQLKSSFISQLAHLSSEEIESLARNIHRVSHSIGDQSKQNHIVSMWMDGVGDESHNSSCPVCYNNLLTLTESTSLVGEVEDPAYPLLFTIEDTYFSLADGEFLWPIINTERIAFRAAWLMWDGNQYTATRLADSKRFRAQPLGVSVGSQPGSFTDYKFMSYDGTERDIGIAKGSLVLLHFWATWCKSCLVELPSLDRLADSLELDISILPVALDVGGLDAVESMYRQIGIKNLSAYFDDSPDAFVKAGISKLPVTFILNDEGDVLQKHVGSKDWDQEAATIKSLAIDK